MSEFRETHRSFRAFAYARSQWAVTGGARCARTIFDGMLASVLRAPVSYFESVPLGRVLSRYVVIWVVVKGRVMLSL